MNSVLEIHDLTVTYEKKPVLWGIDLHVPKGAIVGIVGPNGAGKSTLIKTIMGLIPPSSGFIKLFDQSLSKVRNKISYVPQRESVDWDFPVSALDVVLMGRYGKIGLLKRPKRADIEAAKNCLRQVKMEEFENRQISQLSGGQQQRIFLARSLAQEADLYFMDEPFVGVDAATEKSIIEILKKMASTGKTVVVVHHDLQTVSKYFDWLVLLNTRLVACGPIKDVFTEALLNETYGGQLNVLSEIGSLMTREEYPREHTSN